MSDFSEIEQIELNRLSDCLDIVCSNLSEEELFRVKNCLLNSVTSDVKQQIRDGRDLGIAMRKNAICDETNLKSLAKAVHHLKRYDLLRMLYSYDRKTVKVDPLEEFLRQEENKAKATKEKNTECTSNSGKRKHGSTSGECGSPDTEQTEEGSRLTRKRCRTQGGRAGLDGGGVGGGGGGNDDPPSRLQAGTSSPSSSSRESPLSSHSVPSFAGDAIVRSRYTCDVRLRVWAEYCDHERILNENVLSNKVDPLERQLERFSQASTILQSRDLGYIVCDIKFSEITYLDAFWRDYLNGSLLEALKGVFITESLKQAVGNEPIKLLVSIDEEDYEEGRNVLLGNVYLEAGREVEEATPM